MSQHQAERDHLRADGDDHSAGASHRGGGADDQEGGAFGERESARALEKLTSGLTLFSTRRPQNFVAGLSSGLKNVTRGVLAGTASLVAMPVMGYKAEGYKGAAKNLAMGVASCAVLSVGGVVSGAAQIVRGALNTPEALRETYSNEKMWHHGRREWIEVRLQSDIQSVPHDDSDLIVAARRRQAEEDASAPAAAPSPSIAGTSSSLYDVLEVSRTASTSEVRRAYAKMALKHHPDKNVGDPNAADRFKAVNEAYRVLSDEAARAEYDRTGRRPGQGGPGGEVRLPGLHLHPLQEMLGGEALLPWMGHLRLAVVYVNTDYSLEGSELAEWQRRRVLRVAAHMAQFLSTMEELGRTEGALALSEFLTRKTRELFAASHGRDLMALIANRWHVVALRYKSAADGSVLGRGSAIVEDYRQSVVSVGHSATTVFKTIRQMHTQRQLTPDDAIPMLLQFAESDIVDTVDTAADMVLHDLSVSRDDRWVRMHHLTQLAEFVFHQLADPARRMA